MPLFFFNQSTNKFCSTAIKYFFAVNLIGVSMKSAIQYFFCFILMVLSLQVRAQNSNSRVEKMEELAAKFFENGKFSGSILISENGEPIFSKNYGYSNIASKTPITANTKFLIASISKQFTAALILKLVDDGKLKLTDKLSDFISDYPTELASKITLHHMLTNTSGFPDYFTRDTFEEVFQKAHYYPDMVKGFKDKPLEFSPGSKFQWSNTAWTILEKVIEKASGKSYTTFLKETIIAPLQLKNTSWIVANKKIGEQAAQGYSPNLDEYKPAPEFFLASSLSADGIITTPEDLNTFCQAEFTGKLFSPETSMLLFNPYTTSDSRQLKYGYGWYVGQLSFDGKTNVDIKMMPGGINGYQSLFTNVDNKYSIIVFSNYADATMNQIVTAFARLLTNNTYTFPKKSITPHLSKIIKSQGVAVAIKELERICLLETSVYGCSENEINRFGYDLMNAGRISDAIAIFEFNVKSYPNSWNAFDSLGEAYAKEGNSNLAKENYEKSLKLNPDNTSAVEALKKLSK